jgi:hypothetical protein
VDLVRNGQPVAEIVTAENPTPSVRTAAEELQRHVEAMSGAKLPIVSKDSADVANHVYIGQSDATRKLGVRLDDVKHDGFKIVARQNYVVLAGREFPLFEKSFAQFSNVGRRQDAWEKQTGRKWRFPPMIDYGDANKECGFHMDDGNGTLYAVYEVLEQMGFRWYMPVAEIGMVIPKSKDISVAAQDLKREPEFPQRILIDPHLGRFKDEFLWFKSMRAGRSFVMPIYHSLSGPMELYKEQQPQEYYGVVNGKIDYFVPKLNNPRLRADLVEYLELVDKEFPGIEYACIGQPDGWSALSSADVAAGWDKFAERGASGRFSNYYWDFILDVRKRILEKHPDKNFTVFAYSGTRRPPTSVDRVPENVAVVFCQASLNWMLPNGELNDREQWLKKLTHKDQLLIWEYYIVHAERYRFPPIPAIFTRQMQQNFLGLYDRCAGFTVEIPWSSSNEIVANKLSMRRPGLNHLMLYLHSRLCWDRNLDIPATINEYCELFFGPAKAEMKEFYEFAESVWTRPEPRQITIAGGFLKPADVASYFDILGRAKAKAGDTVFGKRVDRIATEMEPSKLLFEKLKRTGPMVQVFPAEGNAKIDGDLDKPFWRARGYTFTTLRDMVTGETPAHVGTSVSFRWLPDDSALIVGIECLEPRMGRLRAGCKERDSITIFNDDNVEIRLETAQGIRPFIVVNPNGAVYDECLTKNVADLPLWYTVQPVAVKKRADRWTVEVRIDTKPISGERPTEYLPWGVQINRQRLAGNTPEHYMLSPSGANFKDMQCMGNLVFRR